MANCRVEARKKKERHPLYVREGAALLSIVPGNEAPKPLKRRRTFFAFHAKPPRRVEPTPADNRTAKIREKVGDGEYDRYHQQPIPQEN